MKAIQLKKSGKPEVLKLVELPDPIPGPGQVQVQIEYAGINYAEILSRKGLYGWAPQRPYTLGMEAAGTIAALGSGVDPGRVGEKVIVANQFGCYAEKIVVPEVQALKVIPGFTMAENAAYGVNFMTAWVALFELARLSADETVLITAAAGGVGSAAVKLASAWGSKVIGLAGNAQKIQLIEEMGAAKAFNYRDSNYFDQLRAYCGGVDVILEMVGGQVYKNHLQLIKPFGRIVIAGFAGLDLKKWNPLSWWRTWRDLPRVNIMKMAEGSYGVMATHLGYLMPQPDKLMPIYDQMCRFVQEHRLRPLVGEIFPLEEAAKAHRFIESRHSTGKVLLKI